MDFRIYHVTEFLLHQLQDCLKTCPVRQQEKKKKAYMHTELTLNTQQLKNGFMNLKKPLCSDYLGHAVTILMLAFLPLFVHIGN